MLEQSDALRHITPTDRKRFEIQEREQMAAQIGELRQKAEAASALGNSTALRDFDNLIAARLQVADKLRLLEFTRRLRDSLTNLHNKAFFEILVDEMENSPEAFKNTIGFLFIDIDHFKNINDTIGHIEGNKVLKGVAQTIHSSIDHRDVACRWGGEEFLVVLVGPLVEGYSRETILKEVAERIRSRVENMEIQDLPKVTVSVGGAVFISPQREQVEQAVKQADKLLYKAKMAGRNRVEISKES